MFDADTFAARLRELRQERRLSVADLAEAAGLSRNAVYELERGEAAPSWVTVEALAEALAVPTDAFRR